MKTPADMILAEVGDVAQIVQAARAMEEARLGRPVSPHDPAVQVRAAEIILGGFGEYLRAVHGGD